MHRPTSMSDQEDHRGTTTRLKSRWGRLKRSHSDDDSFLPSLRNDIAKKDGGTRSHFSASDPVRNRSIEGVPTTRHKSNWFRKQHHDDHVADVSYDNKSFSERSKKSGGGLFSRSRSTKPRDAVSDHSTGLLQVMVTRETNSVDDSQEKHYESPVFDDDDDNDGVSSFGDDYNTNNTVSSAPELKKAGPAKFGILPIRLKSSKHVDNNRNGDSLHGGDSNRQPQVRSIFRNISSHTDAPKKRTEVVTLRKNVSFGCEGSDESLHHVVNHPQSLSSDHPIEVMKSVSDSKSDGELDDPDMFDDDAVVPFAVKDYGYNSIDFPIPARNQALVSARERARYSVYQGNSNVKKKFRVRPYHCFPDETVTMTEEEIYADSLKPTKEFVPLKSYLVPSVKSHQHTTSIHDSVREMWGSPDEDGRIGALRVEVLGCVGLNRTKPDVSVYMVCGDAAFCSDVLTGYRSPMWPSVSRRACVFPIHHAYAKLYIGVFDVRIRKNKENDVFCGRVAIDISCIRPNTEYDTTMPLRASTFIYDKRKRGVIRVRFSIHWFDERAAVLSYLKSAKSLVDSCPLVDGQPTIPCADPKTFRNVAVTVYGQDLPGKYSRNAFRATAREFNLYQQNIRVVFKVLVLDAMLYEEPWISLYLFGSSIYCVLLNTVALVPAFVVGYLLILYIENYCRYVENKQFHFGYKPLTIFEVFKALILNKEKDKNEMILESIAVEKQTKRRKQDQGAIHKPHHRGSREDQHEINHEKDENNGEIVPLDHREFPFSDRDAYPKFAVEVAIAPGSNKGSTRRLHGRLSVYYSAEAPVATDNGSIEEDCSEADSEHDDETVMTESHMIGDSLYDLDSDHEDDETNILGADFHYKRAVNQEVSVGAYNRRNRIGPPQDTDTTSGNKIPPQMQLKKVEALLHKFSKSISVEMVHAPPRLETSTSFGDNLAAPGMTAPSRELQEKMTKKIKKHLYDDFDKLLGLSSGSSNPVYRIMSSFLGPLMRMIRIAVYLMRISFNVSTWRDPYLSFWVLVMLISLCLLLIVFPWRMFFLVSSVVCLGPQVRNVM
jgi:C2 domain